MAEMNANTWRAFETRSQASSSSLPGSDEGLKFSDDGLDFPPTAYPFRELSTGSIFVLGVIVFVVWGAWKLLSLI
jgi:hypothetical protein